MPSRSLLLCLLVWCTGCSMERTRVETSAVVQFPGPDDTLDFWDTLADQPVATNNDALHGLILLHDGDAGILDSWPQREARAKAVGWLPADATLDPDESAAAGHLAMAGCAILDVRGGLSMRLWGRKPRFCLRELVHIGVLPGISEHEALSGAEFIAFIESLEDRQRVDAAWAHRLQQDEPARPTDPYAKEDQP